VIANFTAPKDMSPAQKACAIVFAYVKQQLDASDPEAQFDTFVVWFSKTLQNWKVLVSTTLPDQMYYEVTYDGDKGCTYLDAYKKWTNLVVLDTPEPELPPGFPTEVEHVEEEENDTTAERADEAPVQAEDSTADNLDEGR